jgi:hypothetical protein
MWKQRSTNSSLAADEGVCVCVCVCEVPGGYFDQSDMKRRKKEKKMLRMSDVILIFT